MADGGFSLEVPAPLRDSERLKGPGRAPWQFSQQRWPLVDQWAILSGQVAGLGSGVGTEMRHR